MLPGALARSRQNLRRIIKTLQTEDRRGLIAAKRVITTPHVYEDLRKSSPYSQGRVVTSVLNSNETKSDPSILTQGYAEAERLRSPEEHARAI